MTTEETPLLASEAATEADHNLIYDRFSPRRKHTIVALIAWSGFIPCMIFIGDSSYRADMRDSKSSSWARSSPLFLKLQKSLVQMSPSSGMYISRPSVLLVEEICQKIAGRLV